jgi:hypothetical protein
VVHGHPEPVHVIRHALGVMPAPAAVVAPVGPHPLQAVRTEGPVAGQGDQCAAAGRAVLDRADGLGGEGFADGAPRLSVVVGAPHASVGDGGEDLVCLGHVLEVGGTTLGGDDPGRGVHVQRALANVDPLAGLGGKTLGLLVRGPVGAGRGRPGRSQSHVRHLVVHGLELVRKLGMLVIDAHRLGSSGLGGGDPLTGGPGLPGLQVREQRIALRTGERFRYGLGSKGRDQPRDQRERGKGGNEQN